MFAHIEADTIAKISNSWTTAFADDYTLAGFCTMRKLRNGGADTLLCPLYRLSLSISCGTIRVQCLKSLPSGKRWTHELVDVGFDNLSDARKLFLQVRAELLSVIDALRNYETTVTEAEKRIIVEGLHART